MDFTVEEIEVMNEPDINTEASDNQRPQTDTPVRKLNLIVDSSVPDRTEISSSEEEIQSGTNAQIGSLTTSVESTLPTSVHHVDLDLSDMFLIEKSIKVEPIDIDPNYDDPLRLNDLNGSAEGSVIKEVECQTSNHIGLGLPKRLKSSKCETGKDFPNILGSTSLKLIRTGQKYYKCGVCGMSFRTSFYLNRHEQTHSGERLLKFKCDDCEKSYNYLSDLTKHKLTHARDKEKSYKCDMCGKSFRNSFYLVDHMRTHKLLECEFCGRKGFVHLYNLNRHRQKHTGEKPFKCVECHKTFKSSSDLSRHTGMHIKEENTH